MKDDIKGDREVRKEEKSGCTARKERDRKGVKRTVVLVKRGVNVVRDWATGEEG